MHSTLHTPNSRRGAFAAAFLAIAILGLAACNGPTGGSTEAEGIRLQGRVIGTSGAPIAGVVVTAARTGLLDTTDAFGRYILSAKTADTLEEAAVLDTLRFVKNGQSLAKVSVTTWIENLPDVQVIQRNITGSLSLGSLFTGRVEFVLRGDGIDSSSPIVTPVYYNALANNYSGFAYFPPSSSVLNYSVYINVYGPDSALLARSQTVPFNSFAGDITVPGFSPTNAFPVANAGGHRTVTIGAQVALNGTAVDAFGGTIAKWEWSINGGPFRQTSSGDTVITAPWTRTEGYPCVLRVTDNDGNTATGIAMLTVTNDSPALSGLVDTLIVGMNASVNFSVAATDEQGVVRYLWDFDGDGLPEDTTATGTRTRAFPGTAGLSRVIVTAQDAYDGSRADTSLIFRLPAGRTWTTRYSGVSKLIRGIAWTGSRFLATADSGILLASPDGATWTPQPVAAGRIIGSVASSGSNIVALSSYVGVGYDSSIHRSTDGTTWTSAMDTLFRARQPGLLEYMGGRYIAFMNPGPTAYVSQDGLNWTQGLVSTSSATDGRGVLAWNGSHYLILPMSSLALKSTDGITWTSSQTSGIPANSTLTGLVWAGDRFVLIAGTQAYQSADGVAWGLVPGTGRTLPMHKAIWADGLIVGVTMDGRVTISPDKGVTWLIRQYAQGALRNVLWNGTRLVAVGASGTILTSD